MGHAPPPSMKNSIVLFLPSPDNIVDEQKLVDGEDNPGDVADEEHGHNAAENQSKICFSSPSFPSSDVRVSEQIGNN